MCDEGGLGGRRRGGSPKEAKHTHTLSKSSARSPLLSSPSPPCWRNPSTEVTAHTRGREPRGATLHWRAEPAQSEYATRIRGASRSRTRKPPPTPLPLLALQLAHTCTICVHTHASSPTRAPGGGGGIARSLHVLATSQSHPRDAALSSGMPVLLAACCGLACFPLYAPLLWGGAAAQEHAQPPPAERDPLPLLSPPRVT